MIPFIKKTLPLLQHELIGISKFLLNEDPFLSNNNNNSSNSNEKQQTENSNLTLTFQVIFFSFFLIDYNVFKY